MTNRADLLIEDSAVAVGPGSDYVSAWFDSGGIGAVTVLRVLSGATTARIEYSVDGSTSIVFVTVSALDKVVIPARYFRLRLTAVSAVTGTVVVRAYL